MLGRFFRFVITVAFQAFWWLLGGLLSVAIRLAPLFFRLCVATTGWVIAFLDGMLEGRLSRRAAFTLLAAGGLWALSGFIVPLLFTLLFHLRPDFFSAPLLIGGFIYGLACGVQARRLPGFGMWLTEDGLQLGENRR